MRAFFQIRLGNILIWQKFSGTCESNFNYAQLFVSDQSYIYLFALSVTQELKLQSQINIVMKKVCSGRLIAGILSRKFL